jgi:hypothetical protein
MSLLSFVGGAAKQFVTSAEQAEEDAKQMAKSSFNGLYKRYEENAESNRELTNKMKAEKQYIETVWQNATPEQVNELLANPVALEAIKKTKNPSSVDLNNYIRVIKGNESKAVGAERAAALGPLVEKVKAAMQPAEPAGGSPLGAFYRDMGKKRMESDMAQFAKAQGVSLEEMQQSAKIARPVGSATFDMGVLQEAPDSVEDMVKTANVARVQAKQKFGEGSAEYKAANETFTSLSGEIEKTDKGLDARANRLNVAILDETDPAKKKALQSELKITQRAIQQHKEATSTRAEKGEDKPKTYGVISRSVDDFVNTRMREDKGFEWRKYVDFKTFTDPATGQTITSRTQKANLSDEQQRELFAKERELTAQALVTNGYVVNGRPRYSEVAEIMNNKGITPKSFGAPAAPATPAAIPTAPAAAPTAPAAAPTAPAAAPTAQPTKTVSAAKVAEQAKANNVTYEQAAAEARKQGYTIR